MILVFGATGNVGGAVARELAAAGAKVRAVVRDPQRAGVPAGVEVVAGDLGDADTLRPALAGADAAFLLSGYGGIDGLVPEMPAAGIERVVLLSSSAAPTGDLANVVARYHILSERAVRDSGLRWTFLRPNSFMSDTYRWLPQLRAGDAIRLPFAEVPIAMIHPDDLGAVAAAA